jgi:hypothetical protein
MVSFHHGRKENAAAIVLPAPAPARQPAIADGLKIFCRDFAKTVFSG